MGAPTFSSRRKLPDRKRRNRFSDTGLKIKQPLAEKISRYLIILIISMSIYRTNYNNYYFLKFLLFYVSLFLPFVRGKTAPRRNFLGNFWWPKGTVLEVLLRDDGWGIVRGRLRRNAMTHWCFVGHDRQVKFFFLGKKNFFFIFFFKKNKKKTIFFYFFIKNKKKIEFF